MKKLLTTSALAIALIVAMVSMSYALELNMTKFTISPTPFKKGQTVGFDVEVDNPTGNTIAHAGDIYFYVKDGTPEREGSGSFLGTTPLPSLAAHSKTTVHLAQTYAAPRGAGDQIVFTVYLPPITPGVEFGPGFQYKFNASCSYSPVGKILPSGLKPLNLPGKLKK